MDDTNTEAQQVYRLFSNTRYGRRLAGRTRYERFRPVGYSVKHWERLLGPDVNNLHHMRRTITVARWFVRAEHKLQPRLFSKREAVLLSITAALHDQAEAIIGDIPHGKKTPAQRQAEQQTLRDYEAAFAPRLRGPALRLYRYGRDHIAFADDTQKLPAAFKTIELIGFMENMLAAREKLAMLTNMTLGSRQANYLGVHTETERKKLITTLERLSAEVLGCGAIEQLIDLGSRFASTHLFLRRHASEISTGFASIKNSTFNWYENGEDPDAVPDEKEHRIQALRRQKLLWNTWIANSTLGN